MDNINFDIVVIGSGVIGHSIAFRIKQDAPQLKIAVLGDPVNSLQASRAAAGMLAPFCECDRADRFFKFCRESLDKFPEFLKELISVSEVSVHFSIEGSLMPSSSYQETWEERKVFFASEDIPHEIWSIDKVRQKAPYLSEDCGEVMWVGEGRKCFRFYPQGFGHYIGCYGFGSDLRGAVCSGFGELVLAVGPRVGGFDTPKTNQRANVPSAIG